MNQTPILYIAQTADGTDLPLPTYSTKFHMGLNLQAALSASVNLNPGESVKVPIGFEIGIPDGFCGQIVSLPELVQKDGLVVLGAPQIIHPANRGPIYLILQNTSNKSVVVRRGLICAQLLILPSVQINWKEIQVKKSQVSLPEKENIIGE